VFEEAETEVDFDEAGAEAEVVFEDVVGAEAELVFEEVGAEAGAEEAVLGAAGDFPNGVSGGGWSQVSPRM